MTMNAALASRINEIAAPLGPIPSAGMGCHDDRGQWQNALSITPAHFIERLLFVQETISPAQQAWFNRLLALAFVGQLHGLPGNIINFPSTTTGTSAYAISQPEIAPPGANTAGDSKPAAAAGSGTRPLSTGEALLGVSV